MAAIAAGCIAGSAAAVVDVGPATPAPSVRLLYLVPSDRAYRADYAAAIRAAFADLRSWYRRQVGRTFSLYRAGPEVCGLPNPARYYAADSWSKVVADVQPCAPVAEGPQQVVWVLYADVAHRCGTPGRLGAGTVGLTILSRQDLAGLVGAVSYDDCGRPSRWPVGRFIGGAGHELGHAFGLSHPPGCDAGLASCDREALMEDGYARYPDTYLRADDKRLLRKSPFFR